MPADRDIHGYWTMMAAADKITAAYVTGGTSEATAWNDLAAFAKSRLQRARARDAGKPPQSAETALLAVALKQAKKRDRNNARAN